MIRLERTRRDQWGMTWGDDAIELVVAGTEQAPDPELEATLRDVVTRWPDVRSAIEAFLAALAPDTPVPLQPPLHGAFAAGDCGFDGALRYTAISVTQRDAPSRARITFYTGLPDGHATFEVAVDRGRPTAIEAFAS